MEPTCSDFMVMSDFSGAGNSVRFAGTVAGPPGTLTLSPLPTGQSLAPLSQIVHLIPADAVVPGGRSAVVGAPGWDTLVIGTGTFSPAAFVSVTPAQPYRRQGCAEVFVNWSIAMRVVAVLACDCPIRSALMPVA